MHVRASEIKDLSRVMDLINQAKDYFKDNGINQWQKGYPDINTILDDILSGNSYVLSEHSHRKQKPDNPHDHRNPAKYHQKLQIIVLNKVSETMCNLVTVPLKHSVSILNGTVWNWHLHKA